REGTGCLRDWRGPRQWPRRYSVCYESSRVGFDLLYRRQFLALRVASWFHSVSVRMPSVLHALKAASCSAFFLLLPKPVPIGSPSTVTCRSEEHTSELQSRENLVCRLLLEKKK